MNQRIKVQIASRKPHFPWLYEAVAGSTNYDEIARVMKLHFIAQGESVGITLNESAQLIVAIVEATPAVIANVLAILAESFNKQLSDSILLGMQKQALKLAEKPIERLEYPLLIILLIGPHCELTL